MVISINRELALDMEEIKTNKSENNLELWELDKFLDKIVQDGCRVINLSHRGLTIVTGRLEEAISAHVLLLNNNKLLMPPGELCSLKDLTELVLDNNMLTMLPSGNSICSL